MNGFSTGEEDSRGAADQICCLLDEGERCTRPAGNASYSKRIQKTVTQRRLKLNLDQVVRLITVNGHAKYYSLAPLYVYPAVIRSVVRFQISRTADKNSNYYLRRAQWNFGIHSDQIIMDD